MAIEQLLIHTENFYGILSSLSWFLYIHNRDRCNGSINVADKLQKLLHEPKTRDSKLARGNKI